MHSAPPCSITENTTSPSPCFRADGNVPVSLRSNPLHFRQTREAPSPPTAEYYAPDALSSAPPLTRPPAQGLPYFSPTEPMERPDGPRSFPSRSAGERSYD